VPVSKTWPSSPSQTNVPNQREIEMRTLLDRNDPNFLGRGHLASRHYGISGISDEIRYRRHSIGTTPQSIRALFCVSSIERPEWRVCCARQCPVSNTHL